MRGCEVFSGRVSSPIGDYIFQACRRGLHRLDQADEVDNENFLALGQDVQLLEDAYDVGENLFTWMKAYFKGKDGMNASLPAVCPSVFGHYEKKRTFRGQVLEVLYREVHSGRALTYGQLADLCGRPGAARAVGSAMSTNPVPLVVPCHRVVPAGGKGKAGHYSGGKKNDVKVWLLRHEGLQV